MAPLTKGPEFVELDLGVEKNNAHIHFVRIAFCAWVNRVVVKMIKFVQGVVAALFLVLASITPSRAMPVEVLQDVFSSSMRVAVWAPPASIQS